MERSPRNVEINMVVDRFIFKNNQITLFRFTSIPKTGMGLLKAGFLREKESIFVSF